jgi:hypothetical protein
VLIGAPIDIDPNPSSQPDIVWNGSEYLATFAWPFGGNPRLSFASTS